VWHPYMQLEEPIHQHMPIQLSSWGHIKKSWRVSQSDGQKKTGEWMSRRQLECAMKCEVQVQVVLLTLIVICLGQFVLRMRVTQSYNAGTRHKITFLESKKSHYNHNFWARKNQKIYGVPRFPYGGLTVLQIVTNFSSSKDWSMRNAFL